MLFILLTPLLLISSVNAVDVRAYARGNCRDPWGNNGHCESLPENFCCTFSPEANSMFSGETKSVLWTHFSECQVLLWYYPKRNAPSSLHPGDEHYNCGGAVRKSFATGDDRGGSHCMSDTGPGGTNDGAKWVDMITLAKKGGSNINPIKGNVCGKPEEYAQNEIGKELRDIALKLKTKPSSFGQDILLDFNGVKHGIHKRQSRQEKRESQVAMQNTVKNSVEGGSCEGVMYATHWGWTPGTGVWVLEGSKEAHERLAEASKLNTEGSMGWGWNQRLNMAGAKYYDHWAEHKSTVYDMLNIGLTYTQDDIDLAKAKRSLNDEPRVDDWYPSDYVAEEEETPRIAERSADNTTKAAIDDSFAGLPELDDEDDLVRRSIDDAIDDSFAGLPDTLDDEGDDDVAKRSPEEGGEYDAVALLQQRDNDTNLTKRSDDVIADSFAGLPELDDDEDEDEHGAPTKRDEDGEYDAAAFLQQLDDKVDLTKRLDADIEDSFSGLPEVDDDEDDIQ